MNLSKYYIISLITILLCLSGLYLYNKNLESASDNDVVQFDFTIDGKHYIIPSSVHSIHFLNKMGFSWKDLSISQPNLENLNPTQVALNLGIQSANGVFFVFAGDMEKVKVTSSNILELANKLGISEEIKNTASALELTEINLSNQNILDDRIMDLEYQIEKTLHKQKKDNLAVLVELGGWIENLYVVSKGVTENYIPIQAEILRQPHIAEIYIDVLTALLKRTKDPEDKKLLDSILKDVIEISNLINHTHKESFPLSKVKKLHQISINLKNLIEPVEIK